MSLGKRAVAEFFGTFWLVLGGCGAAVLAAGFPTVGIGFLGVAFAFGLTVGDGKGRFRHEFCAAPPPPVIEVIGPAAAGSEAEPV